MVEVYLPPHQTVDAGARKILKLWRKLGKEQRECLLTYAEFLYQRDDARLATKKEVVRHPVEVAKAADETVVGAIKRLSTCYPMLEKKDLLAETSALMSKHLLQGVARERVVEELEAVFLRHYQSYRAELED